MRDQGRRESSVVSYETFLSVVRLKANYLHRRNTHIDLPIAAASIADRPFFPHFWCVSHIFGKAKILLQYIFAS